MNLVYSYLLIVGVLDNGLLLHKYLEHTHPVGGGVDVGLVFFKSESLEHSAGHTCGTDTGRVNVGLVDGKRYLKTLVGSARSRIAVLEAAVQLLVAEDLIIGVGDSVCRLGGEGCFHNSLYLCLDLGILNVSKIASEGADSRPDVVDLADVGGGGLVAYETRHKGVGNLVHILGGIINVPGVIEGDDLEEAVGEEELCTCGVLLGLFAPETDLGIYLLVEKVDGHLLESHTLKGLIDVGEGYIIGLIFVAVNLELRESRSSSGRSELVTLRVYVGGGGDHRRLGVVIVIYVAAELLIGGSDLSVRSVEVVTHAVGVGVHTGTDLYEKVVDEGSIRLEIRGRCVYLNVLCVLCRDNLGNCGCNRGGYAGGKALGAQLYAVLRGALRRLIWTVAQGKTCSLESIPVFVSGNAVTLLAVCCVILGSGEKSLQERGRPAEVSASTGEMLVG